MDPHEIGIDESEQETCWVCGLIARNKDELEEHIRYAHTQGNLNNSNEIISPEQKIDPFIKTK
ncbi:MAG: hypothetical protein M3Z01_09830 [Thermoproteota archaeon]|nr:hypothetical protein [Thermoproteota archaeon]